MSSFRSIIDLWPSAESLSDDLGLKHRSHARVMKVRNSIPKVYWTSVLLAAQRRGIALTEAALSEAEKQRGEAA